MFNALVHGILPSEYHFLELTYTNIYEFYAGIIVIIQKLFASSFYPSITTSRRKSTF